MGQGQGLQLPGREWGMPCAIIQAVNICVFGHDKGKCLTFLAISTCHPCLHSATNSLLTSLTSGPVDGSAGPGRKDHCMLLFVIVLCWTPRKMPQERSALDTCPLWALAPEGRLTSLTELTKACKVKDSVWLYHSTFYVLSHNHIWLVATILVSVSENGFQRGYKIGY